MIITLCLLFISPYFIAVFLAIIDCFGDYQQIIPEINEMPYYKQNGIQFVVEMSEQRTIITKSV